MLSFALGSFPLLMIFAACMDLLTMRISNKISIALLLAFAPLAALSGLPFWTLDLHSIGMHYACGLCLLLFTFALYAFGKIGGGDAKLAAASAVWMGWGPVIDYLLIASLLGGALALLILFGRTFALPLFMLKQPWIVNLHKPKGRIPYGVALGLAAVIVYPQTAIWIATQGM